MGTFLGGSNSALFICLFESNGGATLKGEKVEILSLKSTTFMSSPGKNRKSKVVFAVQTDPQRFFQPNMVVFCVFSL